MMDEEDGVANRRGKTKIPKKKSEHRILLQAESIDDLCAHE